MWWPVLQLHGLRCCGALPTNIAGAGTTQAALSAACSCDPLHQAACCSCQCISCGCRASNNCTSTTAARCQWQFHHTALLLHVLHARSPLSYTAPPPVHTGPAHTAADQSWVCCVTLCHPLYAIAPAAAAAAISLALLRCMFTHSMQQHASGTTAWVLCGLLLVLYHELATCSSRTAWQQTKLLCDSSSNHVSPCRSPQSCTCQRSYDMSQVKQPQTFQVASSTLHPWRRAATSHRCHVTVGRSSLRSTSHLVSSGCVSCCF